jgi:import receptor subunit TOM22
MVKLTELPESGSDAEYTTDYDSDVESDVSAGEETLLERLLALKDIIPPETRYAVTSKLSKCTKVGKTMASVLGKVAWVLSTSAILMVAPLVFELEKETQLILFENEQKLRDQSSQQVPIYNFINVP